MKLYVARHAQTNYNDLGLCNSDPKVEVYITELGIKQAKNLAEKLKDVDIDHIFVSELKRTRQTADIVNNFHDAPIEVDSRLNDNRSGYEGRPDFEYYTALDNSGDKWNVRFNEGESLEDVKQRVRSFISELKTKDFNSVLIVTSMTIIQAIYSVIENRPNQEAWDLEVDKASCREFEI